MKQMRSLLPKVILISVLLASCSQDNSEWKPKAQDPEFLHRSVKQITDIIVHDIFSPPVAARIYVYMSVAGYEAAIHADSKYVSLAGQLHGLEPVPQPEPNVEYSYSLASAEAMLKVGRALVFSEDKLDNFYNKVRQEFKDTGMPDDVFERSVAYGT